MRRAAAIVLAVLLVAPALLGASTPKPKLAVILMVDGLSWERLNAWRPWFTSGLKRLLDEGAVASSCRYPHLNTVTSPGHASVATGAPPRVHGIPTNQWYVPSASGRGMEAVYAASQPPPGSPENASTDARAGAAARARRLGIDSSHARPARAGGLRLEQGQVGDLPRGARPAPRRLLVRGDRRDVRDGQRPT